LQEFSSSQGVSELGFAALSPTAQSQLQWLPVDLSCIMCFNRSLPPTSQEPQPLGTGGALRYALKKQKSEHPVIAMNGDTYVALNWEKLIDHHRTAKADLTMALTYARDSRRFGTVKLDRDTPVGFLEKGASRSGWINAGVYVLGPAAQQAILKLPEKSSLEQDFFAPAFTQLQCSAYRSRARFIDIGVPEDFARAQNLLATCG
jgi:D-glycero-alpha-D-manno-heptose 1-phosphate guanylyltransferase